jgi:hypothetical protein
VQTQPSATATAGQPFPAQPVIYVEDQAGNLVFGDNTTQVTAALRVGAGPLLGTTTVTASGGIVTFTNLQDNKAESILLVFTSAGLVKGQANPVTVNPAAASRLSIAAPATAVAGHPFSVVVTAFDPYNNVATGYRGSVHFTSSDRLATLPANYTFTAGDAGVHNFVNGVTMKTSGTQTITVFEMSNRSITGTTVVSVGAGPAITASAGNGGSAGGKIHNAAKARSKAAHAKAALGSTPRSKTAKAHNRRMIAQADKARHQILGERKGNLHAFLVAERMIGSGHDEIYAVDLKSTEGRGKGPAASST